MTDPRGNAHRVVFGAPAVYPDGYSTGGVPTSEILAVGKPEQQTLTYDWGTQGFVVGSPTNLLRNVTDPLGRQTTYTYDSMGNVTSVTRLAGTSNAVTTSFTYETQFQQMASVTDPLGHTAAFTYDTQGNLASVTDPLGNQATIASNPLGQSASVTDPMGDPATQFGYNAGDMVTITDPLQRTVSRTIDGAGRLLLATDPLGNITHYEYDGLNDVTKVTDSQGNATAFVYDPNGNLSSVTSVNGAVNQTTSYAYDNMDRLSTRTDPLLHPSESYQYDGNGNLTQFTDRKGQVTTFTYDALNRRTFVGFGTQAGPTYQSTITTTYDAGDRPTQIVDSLSGTITPVYDGLDRLTSETTPQGSVSYAYDAAGRRTSMTVAGQPVVGYTYDVANRLTQIAQGASAVGFSYDSASRRSALTLPNGVTVAYSFDAASQLTGLTYSLGQTTLGNLTYAYDTAGRRTSVGGSFARTGLPLAVSSTNYNANNQLTQWGTATLTYDLNGNLTGDGVNNYSWDARNQLASIAASGGGTIATFQYDAFGRRTSKTVVGTTTSFLYDRVNAVQELSGSTPTANLLTGGVDQVFSRTDSTGAFTPLTDALGSTIALTDSTGAVQTQYTYEPFGNTTVSGPASTNTFQYTGRENDGTGVYFYRARYYSPVYQRFISEEPMGFGGGDANFYMYAGESPANFVDPLGLDKGGGWKPRIGGFYPDMDGLRSYQKWTSRGRPNPTAPRPWTPKAKGTPNPQVPDLPPDAFADQEMKDTMEKMSDFLDTLPAIMGSLSKGGLFIPIPIFLDPCLYPDIQATGACGPVFPFPNGGKT